MADSQGNDVAAVGIPVTGFFGYAPAATTAIAPTAGGARDFELPTAFKKAGLIKRDGGFDWTLERSGDPLEFWQEGYKIQTGLANATLAVGLAQTDEIVRRLIHGKTADSSGYITIDAGGHDEEFLFFTEEIFKNRVIRRRQAFGTVQSAKENRNTRGEVIGYDAVFSMRRDEALNDEHLGEWLIPATTSS